MGERTDGVLKRRGLLAGAAALAAAVVGKLGTAERAEAAHGAGVDPTALHVGAATNGAATMTRLGATVADRPAFVVTNNSPYFSRVPADGINGYAHGAERAGVYGANDVAGGYGLYGQSSDGFAVYGRSGNSYGVFAQGGSSVAGVRGEVLGPLSSTGSGVVGVAAGCEFGDASSVGVGGSGRGIGASIANKIGVLGITDGSASGSAAVEGWAIGGTGIRGSSNSGGGPDYGGGGIGVEGRSGSGPGVQGKSTGGIGVRGESASSFGVFGSSGSAVGIFGFATSAAGVYGNSPNSVGLFGNATNNAGVYGTSPIIGVWGQTGTGNGVYGEATGPGLGVHGKAAAGGFAGYFEGNVHVTGRITQGGAASPQTASASTVEAFGGAKLENGQATVSLDEATTSAIDGEYHVFLSEGGESNGLFVTGKGPKGFTVKEKRGGTSGVPFSFRVVAARKAPPGQGTSASAEPKDVKLPTPPTPPTLPEVEAPTPGRPDGR